MKNFNRHDYEYMARALQLAERGLYTTDPNPRVGCVIVNDGKIVGEGWHQQAGGPHAEIHALHVAGKQARGATVYVTLEPCCHQGKTPPCTDALIEAGVAKVIAAMQDPNLHVSGQGLHQLREAGIEVATGLLEDQARALNPGFIKRMHTGRPWVRNKLAMSLDGRTAMASGESKWITSDAARRDVHRLRARSSAILTGVGTILADDPAMNVRLEGYPRQPLRVIVDTHLSTPPTARILQQDGRTLIMTCSEDEEAADVLKAAGAEIFTMPFCSDVVDMGAVLDTLGEMEVNEVLVETGATLNGSLLQAGLIDELLIYMAPKLLGDEARGLFRLSGLETMQDAIELEISDIRAVGSDWRIRARIKSEPTGQ
jgi:diaminohydroxyphosphoribosylaminopyrimidine deaminase/5-amino-6-(5-phosphoribosylamino)uracil reductase